MAADREVNLSRTRLETSGPRVLSRQEWAKQCAEDTGSVIIDLPFMGIPSELRDDVAYRFGRMAGHFGNIALGLDAICPRCEGDNIGYCRDCGASRHET